MNDDNGKGRAAENQLSEQAWPQALGYRAEIDGLRCLAVAAVILNHINPVILPSGYLGVDIFFVISGYVITASLWRQRGESLPAFLGHFYGRRIKRLLPALALMVVVSSILICLVSADPGVLLGFGWRAVFGLANLQFYQSSTDYFGQDITLNPFTHTWSLGVEEQFYLIFPLLVWWSGFGRHLQGRRRLLVALSLLAVPSLIGFLWLYPRQPAAAYFLMPPRFWELAAGCLLFAGFTLRRQRPGAGAWAWIHRLPPCRQAWPRCSRGLPLALLALLLASLLLPSGLAVLATPTVVLLSVALIAVLRPGDPVQALLSSRVMVGVGLMSYSLYLWHWPVLCISRWTLGVHLWNAPLLLGLMLALGAASYRWLESPLRRARWGRQPGQLALRSLLLAVLTALVPASLARLPQGRLFSGDLERERQENQFMVVPGSRISDKTCNWYQGAGPELDQAKRDCTLIGPDWRDQPRVFLRGDSHTGNLVAWLDQRRRRRDHWLQLLYVSSVPAPVLERTWPADERSWRQLDGLKQRQLLNQSLQSMQAGDVLVLSNHLEEWLGRFTLQQQGISPADLERRWRRWLASLEHLLLQARNRRVAVVLMLPTPQFAGNAGQLDTSTLQRCSQHWFRPVPPAECRQQRLRAPIARELSEIKGRLQPLAKRFSHFHLFDPLPLLCPANQQYCSNYSNNVRTYFDANHLNLAGSQLLADPFDRALERWGLLPRAAADR